MYCISVVFGHVINRTDKHCVVVKHQARIPVSFFTSIHKTSHFIAQPYCEGRNEVQSLEVGRSTSYSDIMSSRL